MEKKTYRTCLKIAVSYKKKYGIIVTADTFKQVLVLTLCKLSRIRSQIKEYADANSYIPLLFEDCLYEHYMFESLSTKKGKVRNERAVI